jgi:hypothetical protein
MVTRCVISQQRDFLVDTPEQFLQQGRKTEETLIEMPCVIGRLHLCAGVTKVATMQSS